MNKDLTQVFCPFCGQLLDDTKEGLYCKKGQIYFSEYLTEQFKTKDNKINIPQLNFRVGKTWHCINCSKPMEENIGYIKCNHCKFILNQYIHQLVEQHFHLSQSS